MTRLSDCFALGPAGFVGATVEFLPVALLPGDLPPGSVFRRLRHGYLSGTADGVLAVSAPPAPGLDVAIRQMTADLAMARAVLGRMGVAPGERAIDTHRPAGPLPDPGSLDGRRTALTALHNTTAAVRVALDAGPDEAALGRRWATAQAVGPVLAAAFANSPLRNGHPTGWHSTRQALRLAADRPMPPGDPMTSWSEYALAAFPAYQPRPAPTTVPGPATRDGNHVDHGTSRRLDALPAPVRACGHLELSMIDAQPGDGWRVALAVATALIEDDRAADEARAVTAGLGPDAWTRAARDALADPGLAEAARRCFLAAYAALARQGTDRHLRDAVATYIHRYVSHGRTPADDLLDALRAPT
jgi:glutamate--cysteine ligase